MDRLEIKSKLEMAKEFQHNDSWDDRDWNDAIVQLLTSRDHMVFDFIVAQLEWQLDFDEDEALLFIRALRGELR